MDINDHMEMSVLETLTELQKSCLEFVGRIRDKELDLHKLTLFLNFCLLVYKYFEAYLCTVFP